jgi:hypothetical protein
MISGGEDDVRALIVKVLLGERVVWSGAHRGEIGLDVVGHYWNNLKLFCGITAVRSGGIAAIGLPFCFVFNFGSGRVCIGPLAGS